MAPEIWEKSDELQDAQQPERPEHGEAGALVRDPVHEALVDFERAEMESKNLSIIFLKKWAIPSLFFFIFDFSIQLTVNK